MVFAPLHALADVLPFLGRVSRGLIGCVTFPVALLLSAFTTIISLVLHSWIAVALLSIAVVAGIGFWLSRKSASA
jgi:hypothetical protein